MRRAVKIFNISEYRQNLKCGTPPYDHIINTTTFLLPKRIESPVIYLVLQPQ